MMKGRSLWEVSMRTGASLGGGPCLEQSMSPLGGGEQRVRECRTQSLEEECTRCKGREELLSQNRE